jgi:hypothetical protein
MIRIAVLIASFALLSACGPSAVIGGAHADACALIAKPDALFGAGAQVAGDNGVDDMAGACRFASADGKRSGEVVLYTAESLRKATPDTRLAEVIKRWDAWTETPIVALDGANGQIATGLPGGQTQIALRNGDQHELILASTGDGAMTSEALARAMAKAAGSAT